MKEIFRGIFVRFGRGFLSAFVGNTPAVVPKFWRLEITAPPHLLEIVFGSLGDAA